MGEYSTERPTTGWNVANQQILAYIWVAYASRTSTRGSKTMPELIWDGKYNEDGQLAASPRVSLPFQTVETVNQ